MHFVRLSIVALALVVTAVAAEREPDRPHGREILSLMGAKMENGGSPDALASYKAIFNRLDANNDGWLNTKEFVEDGMYLTRQARQGIFRASDSDSSGLVTKDEYVVNRVITDEAKTIVQATDKNGDGRLVEDEFVTNVKIQDKKLAAQVFKEFDLNGDGQLVIPEYLRVWGQWAREAPVTARLVVKKGTYVLPREWQGEDFRKRIREEKECYKRPAPPKVDLVLVLRNTGKDPVMIWPGGGIDEPELSVGGPGIVVPDSLEAFSCSNSAMTPQPVILPGEKFRIPINSLNPGGFSLANVYWTEAGEYTITAKYPVWKNLPPHLPGLFKHPEPKGPPIKFLVKTPPVKVKVVAGE